MSQPRKPDGTDPRIVTPSEDDETVKVSSSWNSSGDAYHTTDCAIVARIESVREVQKSVAEWKGFHECTRCINEGEWTPDFERETTGAWQHFPTTVECAAWRSAIANGTQPRDVADGLAYSSTTIRRHALGRCDHDVTHPPVAHGWHTTPEVDESDKDRTKQSQMHPTRCVTIRKRLLDGATTAELKEKYAMRKKGIRRHAKGECQHVHHETPPLAYGWHVVRGEE